MTAPQAGPRVPAWALPGELAALAGGWPGRRTVRDWLVDAGLFLVAVGWWFLELPSQVKEPDPAYLELIPAWMISIDPWVGIAACLAVWWRRRFPLALAVAMVPVLMVSGTALGAVLISLFTLAVHRGWLLASAVTAAQMSQAVLFALLWQPPELPGISFAVFMVLLFVAPLGWGLVVRFRRQLVLTLRRDAQRERAEHARRLAAARRAERERIAREMHDVLAHRISLVSVHAGALAYRTAQAGAGAGAALTGDEVTEAVRVIRDNAHQALTELGEVLSVLRAGEPDGAGPGGDGSRRAPPLLSDLPRLVAEARAAGQEIDLELDLAGGPAQPPPVRRQEQRTVYRVVQEGLTNARKHAPRQPVAVRLTGGPDRGLEVTITNPLPGPGPATGIPGAGAGLAGLAERVQVDGGSLEHRAAGGAFRLTARLPWRAEAVEPGPDPEPEPVRAEPVRPEPVPRA